MIPLGVQHKRDYTEMGSWDLLPNNIQDFKNNKSIVTSTEYKLLSS